MRHLSKKRQLQDYAARSARDEYRALRGDRCAVCWTTEGKIDEHHLCGKAHPERHDARNLLYTCARCHRHYHSGGELVDGVRLPELTPGHLLWCKAMLLELDVDFILKLKGWSGLPIHWQLAVLPEQFLSLRH